MKDSKTISNQYSELKRVADNFKIPVSSVMKAKEDLKTNDREQIERYLEATVIGNETLAEAMEIETFGDLKLFLNLLNEDQLKQRAGIIGEDSFYRISSAEITTEEMVNPGDGEGSILVSDYDIDYYDGRPLDDPENTIIPAGFVLIHQDF